MLVTATVVATRNRVCLSLDRLRAVLSARPIQSSALSEIAAAKLGATPMHVGWRAAVSAGMTRPLHDALRLPYCQSPSGRPPRLHG
jgi:hypothetical protein